MKTKLIIEQFIGANWVTLESIVFVISKSSLREMVDKWLSDLADNGRVIVDLDSGDLKKSVHAANNKILLDTCNGNLRFMVRNVSNH